MKLGEKFIIFAALLLPLTMLQGAQQPTTPQPQPTQQVPQPTQQKALVKTEQKVVNYFTTPIPTKTVAGKQEISFSATLALTGAQSIIGKKILDGMNLYFNRIREQKDLPFRVKLSTLDDRFSISKANKNIHTLMPKSSVFLSLFGTDILTILQEHVKEQKILGLFPIEGIEKLRGEQQKNLIYFRAPHKQELKALVDYSIKKLNKKKIAIFYEAGEWGESVLEELKSVLDQANLELIVQASYPQKTVNIETAVNTIAKKAPNAIFCIAQARPAYNFIRQILNRGLHNTVFFGISSLFSIQKTLKRSRGIKIITTSVVPDPFRSKLEIAQEYRADMKKYLPNKNISPFIFEGYINAALTVHFLKQTGLPVTPEKLRETIINAGTFNFKGLELEFDKNTQTFSSQVWINKGKNKEWFLAKN